MTKREEAPSAFSSTESRAAESSVFDPAGCSRTQPERLSLLTAMRSLKNGLLDLIGTVCIGRSPKVVSQWGGIAVAVLLVLGGCTMNGYPDTNGKINLGPNALGDDPIPRQNYPSYAEYSVAHHEAPEMEKDGYNAEQQVCFFKVMLDHLPADLTARLNDYATGRVTIMESQYVALQKEMTRYTGNVDFVRPIKPELDRCLT